VSVTLVTLPNPGQAHCQSLPWYWGAREGRLCLTPPPCQPSPPITCRHHIYLYVAACGVRGDTLGTTKNMSRQGHHG
jgi:hypothetical protein